MNPDSRRIGPCRYLASAKPRIDREPVSFFHCGACGSMLTGWPSESMKAQPCCCGETM